MSETKRVWMVRAGNDNQLVDQVEPKRAVAVGWSAMGALTPLTTRADFALAYRTAYPDHSDARANVNASQIYRYTREIKSGDYVVTYDKGRRQLLIGRVIGPYEFLPSLFSENYPQVRRVDWIKRVSRDDFSEAARNSMGSTLTVFNLDDYLGEIEAVVVGTTQHVAEDERSDAPPFYDEVKAKADELIADLISRLDPYDFQDLAAALLRAMGFHSVSSAPGPDRGIDIVAHPDALGFEQPRIKAQVKHTAAPIGGPDMRSFLGTLRSGDSGLFISTSGFTRDAIIESERSREPVTLANRDKFIGLLLNHYEALEPEFKAKVPLRRVWVPAE